MAASATQVAGVTQNLELITPEIAAEMLKRNGVNRPVNAKRVDHYARLMSAALFLFNGDTIRLTIDDDVLDGQHRMLASVKSGEAFWAIVVRGLPRTVQSTMDTGGKRTLKDTLCVQGETHATGLSAALSWLAAIHEGPRGVIGPWSGVFAYAEQVQQLAEWPELRSLTARIQSGKLKTLVKSAGLYAALFAIFGRVDAEKAESLLTKLEDGLNLTADDPAAALRQQLIVEHSQRAQGTRLRRYTHVVLAWNAAYQDRGLRALRTPDILPRIAGWAHAWPTPVIPHNQVQGGAGRVIDAVLFTLRRHGWPMTTRAVYTNVGTLGYTSEYHVVVDTLKRLSDQHLIRRVGAGSYAPILDSE